MTAPEQPTPEDSPTTEAIGLAMLYGIKKDERRLALAIDTLAAQRAAEARREALEEIARWYESFLSGDFGFIPLTQIPKAIRALAAPQESAS